MFLLLKRKSGNDYISVHESRREPDDDGKLLTRTKFICHLGPAARFPLIAELLILGSSRSDRRKAMALARPHLRAATPCRDSQDPEEMTWELDTEARAAVIRARAEVTLKIRERETGTAGN